MRGTIRNLVDGKGYGFIRTDDGREWFFHASALPEGVDFASLYRGQLVSFEGMEGAKGPRAEGVTLVDG